MKKANNYRERSKLKPTEYQDKLKEELRKIETTDPLKPSEVVQMVGGLLVIAGIIAGALYLGYQLGGSLP